jgi:hypothetical protein
MTSDAKSTDPESATTPVAESELLDNGGRDSRLGLRKLSSVSKMYDVNNDGELDDAELAMRNLDKSKRGYLSNEKVYELMKSNIETQHQLFKTRRIVFVLLAVVVVLALSNLGTSFAAAYLAKDTTTNDKDELTRKASGETVSTQTTTDESIEIENAVEGADGRRRLCDPSDPNDPECKAERFLWINKSGCALMTRMCERGNTVTLRRTWRKGGKVSHYNVCPISEGTLSDFDVSRVTNRAGVSFQFEQFEDGCRISGDAVQQEQGDICEHPGDCKGVMQCGPKPAVDLAGCQRRCGFKRWRADMAAQCAKNCDHDTCTAVQ